MDDTKPVIIEDPSCRTSVNPYFIGIPLAEGTGFLEVSKEEYERIVRLREKP